MNRHSLFYVPSTPSLCLWEDKAFSGKCSFFDLVWWAPHLLTNPALATAGSGVVLCPSTCGYGWRGGPWPRSATSTESGVRGLLPFWLWLCKNGDSKATDIEMWLQRGMTTWGNFWEWWKCFITWLWKWFVITDTTVSWKGQI